jgi:hypothetical protein
VLKVALCTEHLAGEEVQRAFAASMQADPMWPALPFGEPHVLWRRAYRSGAHAIGIAYSLDEPGTASARRYLEGAGYFPVTTTPTLELRCGRARARFLGLLWWQREDRPP